MKPGRICNEREDKKMDKIIVFTDLETITEEELQEENAYESDDEQLSPEDC